MNDQLSQHESLDLRAYLRPVWRRRWIVLAITVLAAVATYFVSARQQKSYSASSSIYVTDPDPTLDITDPGTDGLIESDPQSINNIPQLMTAASVTQAVSRILGMPVSAAGSVSATASSSNFFVTVTATSRTPVLAARLANAYVSAFLLSRSQAVAAEAARDVKAAKTTLATLPSSDSTDRQDLLQQVETYQQVVLNPSSGATQTNKASVPGAPSSPRPVHDAIFGGLLGLVLAVIVAYCLDLFDRRLVTVSAVELAFERPVLAVLPHISDPTPLLDGHRPTVPPEFVEELRSLMVMLRLGSNSEPPRILMVTSTLPQEGKSTVTRDLALVYAQSGERVLVIDGDLRSPSMKRLFGIKAKRGLAQILRGDASLSDVAVTAVAAQAVAKASTNGHGQTGLANGENPGGSGSVDVVAHGTRMDNPLALMASDRMVALLEEASKAYDIVLIDTPPVLAVADSVPLIEVVDSVLLVARLGQTTRQAAKRFNELVARLSADTFSGVIANDRRARFDEDGYGSYGHYGRDYGKRGKAEQTTDDASEEATAGLAAS
jgi:Mrp family chromosome partitioning ATPase/capsular polysaccharide biosynthesis protein